MQTPDNSPMKEVSVSYHKRRYSFEALPEIEMTKEVVEAQEEIGATIQDNIDRAICLANGQMPPFPSNVAKLRIRRNLPRFEAEEMITMMQGEGYRFLVGRPC